VSPAGQAAFDDLEDSLFAKFGPLNYADKMGVAQRLLALVEELEEGAMQQQQAELRRAKQANPAANMLLSYAQQNKPDEISALLAASGIDPSDGNSVGQTALHVACLWGNHEAATALIGHGADVNRTNSLTGGAPLHITCTSPKALEGRVRCAALLLESGADPLLADGRGMTPLAYAADEPSLLAVIKPFADRAAAAGGGSGGSGGGGMGKLAIKNENDGAAAAADSDDDMPELLGE
jgi:ankyrin repeat protein